MERLDYKWKFREEIIKRSPEATTCKEAVKQWKVILKQKGKDDCICSYSNIENLNIVQNKKTNEVIIVGDCCVKKFEIEDCHAHCRECNKPLANTNTYVKALYKKGVILDETMRIVGHRKCAERIKKHYLDLVNTVKDDRPELRRSMRPSTLNMMKYFVQYFNGMIVRADIDEFGRLILTYDDCYEDFFNLLDIKKNPPLVQLSTPKQIVKKNVKLDAFWADKLLKNINII